MVLFSGFFKFSSLQYSLEISWLKEIMHLSWPTPKCQKFVLRRRAYYNSTGILTCFPFLDIDLWCQLGSTYPWLNCIVKEPLPFRWYRFSLYFGLTLARILNFERFTLPLRSAFARTKRLPIITFCVIYSIGNQFSPVHFKGLSPWQVSCYALFKEWLLLSQPPRCLWQ